MANKSFWVSLVATVLILGSAIIVVGVMMSFKKEPQAKKTFKNERYVTADTVTYSTFKTNVVAFGRLKSINKIQVFSEVQGVLESSDKVFKTGTKFLKDDVMIKIDDRQTRLDLRSAKSQFLSLITSIMPDIKTDFKTEYVKWNTYLESFDIEKPIQGLPELSSSKEKYFLSNRNIFNQFYSIKNLELRLAKHLITAPFSGAVISHNVELGVLIRPGQLLGEFASLGLYELELAVSENDYKFISTGNKVKVLDNKNGKVWTGTVSRIADNIDPQTQTIKTYVKMTGQGIKDGMYLRAEIEGEEIEKVFEINRSAIVNNTWVHIIEGSKLSRKDIVINKLNQETAFISGLDSGQVVITEPLANVALGSEVNAIQE